MRILGIETTCDETGAALVEDGYRILANTLASQVPLHERFGGVVPEVASRAHVEVITRMIQRALEQAGLAFRRDAARPVDAIAVAHRPGLIGSLLVGVTAAKALALGWERPLIGVDHLHAHIYAAFLSPGEPRPLPAKKDAFPAVSLIVSGGHTSLYLSRSWTRHEILGSTIDDAAGEAFDKAAAILGLGYPGGPAISRYARRGDPQSVPLPRTLLDPESLDFSFSGLKTAVLYHVKGQNARRRSPRREDVRVADVAASFQEAVVDVLVEKLRRALRTHGLRRAIVGGGVAANERLRERLDALRRSEGIELRVPAPSLCTDNGAMIAGLGYHLLRCGASSDLTLDASPGATP